MIAQSEIDRIDSLRKSQDGDVRFLLGALDRVTETAMVERNNWSLLMMRIGKQLGCLASCFPDGNDHIHKAAINAKELREAVKPFIEHAGDHDYWGQFGDRAWESLRIAYRQ